MIFYHIIITSGVTDSTSTMFLKVSAIFCTSSGVSSPASLCSCVALFRASATFSTLLAITGVYKIHDKNECMIARLFFFFSNDCPKGIRTTHLGIVICKHYSDRVNDKVTQGQFVQTCFLLKNIFKTINVLNFSFGWYIICSTFLKW